MTDPSLDHQTPPRRRRRLGWGAAVLFLVGMYVLGRAISAGVPDALLPGPDTRALAGAVHEVIRAAELPVAERDAALRAVLARLEDTRSGRSSPAERELVETVRGLLGAQGGEAGGPTAADPVRVLEALSGREGEEAARRLVDLARRELGAAPAPPPEARSGEAARAPAEPVVGQWVVLRETTSAPAAVRFTYRWISAVDAEAVSVTVVNLTARPPHTPSTAPLVTSLPRGAALTPGPGAPRERVVAGGTAWDCARIELPGPGGGRVTTWVTDQLPVYPGLPGFVRQTVHDAAGNEASVIELTRWGARGGSESGPP